MTTNLRSEKLVAAVLPVVGLAWATRAPAIAPPPVIVRPTGDRWVIDAADALVLAWAAHAAEPRDAGE